MLVKATALPRHRIRRTDPACELESTQHDATWHRKAKLDQWLEDRKRINIPLVSASIPVPCGGPYDPPKKPDNHDISVT
jgi:hypothetical protein